MLRRYLLLPLLFLLTLGAAIPDPISSESEAALYADRFETRNNLTHAYGHILLSYDNNLFMGDKAVYDRSKNSITITGNVEILGAEGNKIHSDSIVFDIGKNRITFKNFYHTDNDDIWLAAKEAIKQDSNYSVSNSFLSSCSSDNPDWSLHFERADYDSESKYMALHDVKLYVGESAVAYLPYLAFSLDRKRSSGFLMPYFGYSGDEGFIYEQPYFWAISPSMDLEFNPQIRTERGAGLYATFRFADSPHSHGEIRAGYFKDFDSFSDIHNLKYDSHYGLELLYENYDFLGSLKPKGYRDGLYANIDLFNDIDYLNLQHNPLSHFQETSRYKESRFNYFLYSDVNYFGLTSRYFIDTESLDNDKTLQELPALQYHRFSENIFNRYFEYSVDMDFRNYYREEGTRGYRGVFSLPLSFHHSFMNDFLNLSVTEELRASDNYFSEAIDGEKHYYSLVANSEIELSANLIKAYSSGIHTMLLSATYTKSSILDEGNLHYDDIKDSIRYDFSIDPYTDSRITLSMHHFWESNGGMLHIDYLLKSDYYPESDSKWSLLRQELDIGYDKWKYSSLYTYSFLENETLEFSNKLSYRDEIYAFSIDYTWKKDYLSYVRWQKELKVDARYRQNDEWSWYGALSYDFENDYSKDWEVGLMLDRKCWNLQFIFKQETTPVLRDSGPGSIHNNSIFFKFNLVPFGGTGLDRRLL
jgi:LPS-assembly protein